MSRDYRLYLDDIAASCAKILRYTDGLTFVLLDGLMQAAQTAMEAVVAQDKRQAIKLGYIVVLQTAGRSATYNPHLHVIMTDGGLRPDGTWQRLGYLPYALLHRTWQAHVLQMIATRLAGNERAQALVAEMWRRYPNGFVAYLHGTALWVLMSRSMSRQHRDIARDSILTTAGQRAVYASPVFDANLRYRSRCIRDKEAFCEYPHAWYDCNGLRARNACRGTDPRGN